MQTRILPDIKISHLTPVKKRFFLKYLARFLLLFESVKPVGSFLDNKRVVLVAVPHQSGKDEYLMALIILALDVDVCYLSAKWTMRKLPNPFSKSKDIDVTCVGKIHNIFEDDGNIYYAVCNTLFLSEEIQNENT